MRPSTGVALSLVAVHAIAVTVVHWPHWWTSLISLTCSAFAWVGASEPTYEKSPRHADVKRAQRTRLGEVLMRREGWILARPVLASAAIVAVTSLAVLAALGLSPAKPVLVIMQISIWAPVVLLAAGFLLAQMVNIWALSGSVVGFGLLFGVISAVAGDWLVSLQIFACGLGLVASLFCVDQLRGIRRALEPAQG